MLKLRAKTKVLAQRNARRKSLYFLAKVGLRRPLLRPNFSSENWLSKNVSQKVKSHSERVICDRSVGPHTFAKNTLGGQYRSTTDWIQAT